MKNEKSSSIKIIQIYSFKMIQIHVLEFIKAILGFN